MYNVPLQNDLPLAGTASPRQSLRRGALQPLISCHSSSWLNPVSSQGAQKPYTVQPYRAKSKVGVLVFYDCITDHHKLSSLQQHTSSHIPFGSRVQAQLAVSSTRSHKSVITVSVELHSYLRLYWGRIWFQTLSGCWQKFFCCSCRSQRSFFKISNGDLRLLARYVVLYDIM